MHTIRKQGGKWLVQCVEPEAEEGYLAQRHTVATCRSAMWAATTCSWLNGGTAPEVYTDEDITWEGK